MSYPVQQGRIVDFDNMQKIWEHLFSQELKVQPENYKFFVTECPKND